MSTNIIDVALDYSSRTEIPLLLVASRRQIECAEFGGGYVNNWSTEDFVSYVRQKSSAHIYLERDHGGPWQGLFEVDNKLNLADSMKVAKTSYEADIDAGMQLIHIDPTIPVGDEVLTNEKILARLFELYEHVVEYARAKNKEIAIEVGTEEQNGRYTDLTELESFLTQTTQFCEKNKFDRPLFVVIQTGAKVIESRNIGAFETEGEEEKRLLSQNIRAAADVARKQGIFVKEHNADYLSAKNLQLRPELGIRAANVAPEFGFIETTAFVNLLSIHGQSEDLEKFIDIVNDSGKWKKWLAPESTLEANGRALLAGHYCYSDDRVIEIKNRLAHDLRRLGCDLDEELKKPIRASFEKYLSCYGWLG